MVNVGDRAPDFSLESDSGKKVGLADFPGKTVVLYFYPKDDTPGCTREAQAFSAGLDAFAEAGAVVLGVSRDSVDRHRKFRDKYDLGVPLLSDPDLVAHNAYGAYGEKTMYGKKVTGTIRSTFIIGPDRKVKHVFSGVKVDGHADAVLALVRGGDAHEAHEAPPARRDASKSAAAKSAAKAPAKKAAAKAPAKPAAKPR
ncbi:bacterioferritin comigratory protein [Sorangium cellulosum]|uniref:thioredoxin-dependent peroxiredoxin n=1 Tax=Sorangium cellulosum TaxID=56 RepID=A0A150T4Q3_SORCE|nr:bacterioferritin comigratory protein [Sorangium cellulosum]KYF99457.1 bacterioferritin comigratory protein [Sorangium cellulosum]